jgi:hypothetical protein
VQQEPQLPQPELVETTGAGAAGAGAGTGSAPAIQAVISNRAAFTIFPP